jgi:hypothetical protein
MDARLSASGGPFDQIDRPQFFADVKALELRLAIIDDRFERLASRPDDAYQTWRRDTVTRLRSLAIRAGALEAHAAIEAHHRRRVAALLTVLRRRIAQLDERHARHRDRRDRRRDGPLVGGVDHRAYQVVP